MRNVLTAILLAAVAGAAPLWADTVVLKNGGKLEGIVQDLGDRVRVETGFGAMEFPRSMVGEILVSPTPLKEYRDRARGLAEGDVAGHFALGEWAQAHDLDSHARKEFERVLALDPNHEGARTKLGYEKVNDRWLTHDEAQRARGLVLVDGQWITKEEAELREALAHEAALREQVRVAEERERRRQERLARLEAAAEARLAALEAENARLRDEYARSAYRETYGGGGYGYGYGYGYGGVAYPANYGYPPYYGYYPGNAGGYYPYVPAYSGTGYPGTYTTHGGEPVTFGQNAAGAVTWFTPAGQIHASDDGHTVTFNSSTGTYSHDAGGTRPDIFLKPSVPPTAWPFPGAYVVPRYYFSPWASYRRL